MTQCFYTREQQANKHLVCLSGSLDYTFRYSLSQMIVSSPSWNKAPTVYACFGGVSLGEHTAISTSGCDWGPSGMLRLVSRLEGGHLARLWSDWWGVRGNCALARLSTCEKAECRANLQCRCVPVKAKAFTRPKQTFADGKSQSILILDPWFYFFKPSLLLEPPPHTHTYTHNGIMCFFSHNQISVSGLSH